VFAFVPTCRLVENIDLALCMHFCIDCKLEVEVKPYSDRTNTHSPHRFIHSFKSSLADTAAPLTMDILKQVKVQDLERIYAAQSSSRSSNMTASLCTEEQGEGGSGGPLNHKVGRDAARGFAATASTSVHANANADDADVDHTADQAAIAMDRTNEDKPKSGPREGKAAAVEEIVSTALRIQDSNGNDESIHAPMANENAKEDNEPVLTLHFKSGLCLPISTQSQSNKKVIENANAGKAKESSQMPSPNPNTSAPGAPDSEKSNEVHKHLSFRALQTTVPTTPTTTTTTPAPATPDSDVQTKRNNAQRIAEAKQSAARAMLASSNQGSSSRRLLKNLRFAFSSARDFHHVKGGQASFPALGQEDSVVLTFDPLYLSEQSGMQFLSDVESVIESELKKVSSSSVTRCKFLSGDFRIQGDQDDDDGGKGKGKGKGLPHWLRPFLQTPESDVSLVLILLARIEQSIVQSYRQQQHDVDVDVNLVTPPRSPSRDSADDSNAGDHFMTPCGEIDDIVSTDQQDTEAQVKGVDADVLQKLEVVLLPQCLGPMPSNGKNDKSYLSDIFKSCERLKGQNQLTNSVNIPSLPISRMRVQDLLLVPAEQVSLVYSSDMDSVESKEELMDQFISKWNNVINAAHGIVNSTTLGKKGMEPKSTGDEHDDIVELFADDTSNRNNTKKKKKKKKKKVCSLINGLIALFFRF